MEGLFGFILLRCSSYILQTPGEEANDMLNGRKAEYHTNDYSLCK